MDNVDEDFLNDIPNESPKRYCSLCGKLLSRYNKFNHCYHHLNITPTQEIVVGQKMMRKSVEQVMFVMPQIVAELVCENFGTTIKDLGKRGLTARTMLSRQILAYLLYKDSPLSGPDIATFLCVSHATVLYNIGIIKKDLLAKNSKTKEYVDRIRSRYPAA